MNDAPPRRTLLRHRLWSAGTGWFVGLAVLAVVAVNAAGVWEIGATRREVLEQMARLFQLETVARALAVESALSATRVDLAFLAGSPAFLSLEAQDAGGPAAAVRSAIGPSLLLFLRGHPEIAELVLRSPAGAPLIFAGRPRGLPGFWLPTPGEARSTAKSADPERPVTVLDAAAREPAGRPLARLEATLDPSRLLVQGRTTGDDWDSACALHDRNGTRLGAEPAYPHEPPGAVESARGERMAAEAPVLAEDWTALGPWELRCVRPEASAVMLFEPLAARYRMTIVLNLMVMGVTVLLGVFAVHQARRRQSLEAQAREETRVRELERQLFHVERLGTVGRLAAGMAHEINNPLEGMSNYLRLAKEALHRGASAEAERHLGRAGEGVDRVAAIARRVLDHADPSSPPMGETDLVEVVGQAVEFIRAREEFGGIRFDVELDRTARRVWGSPVMLGQVFLNLVLNACEMQPHGGEVRVRTERRGTDVMVEIADRGPGVPAADRRRIFEPFFSTKQSSGLGLSICHSIVNQHRGELNVEDREGGGAVFRVRLRAAEVAGGKHAG